jgi:putative transposase
VKMDPFIEAEEATGRSVARCCALFQVSRAAYYQRRRGVASARALADRALTAKISAIHTDSGGTYGAPRVHRQLRKRGVACGRRRVARLRRRAGLAGRCQRRWRTTTIPDAAARAQDLDLIQRAFAPGVALDTRYCGDITYLATWEGWAYLATVIDLASRRHAGWALADHLRTELVSAALETALGNRRPAPGAIVHSDRGCQYTASGYRNLARGHGVVLSLGRTGDCFDNAVAESFFATLKRELVAGRAWPTRAGLRRALFDYIDGWYNTRRLHSALGYRSPAEYEAAIHGGAERLTA